MAVPVGAYVWLHVPPRNSLRPFTSTTGSLRDGQENCTSERAGTQSFGASGRANCVTTIPWSRTTRGQSTGEGIGAVVGGAGELGGVVETPGAGASGELSTTSGRDASTRGVEDWHDTAQTSAMPRRRVVERVGIMDRSVRGREPPSGDPSGWIRTPPG
jgi:hypothetical protein